MRNLKRNQQKIYYQNLSDTEVTDEWGNSVKGYSGDPIGYMISVSANSGEASVNGFGTELNYDRTMSTTDKSCPINEYSRLWIVADTSKPHDFEVIKVAKSLNQILYAIKQVDISIAKSETNGNNS